MGRTFLLEFDNSLMITQLLLTTLSPLTRELAEMLCSLVYVSE